MYIGNGVRFTGARFLGNANFVVTDFRSIVSFADTGFAGELRFEKPDEAGLVSLGARFYNDVVFDRARFAGLAHFTEVEFRAGVSFDGARFASETSFEHVAFNRWADRETRFDNTWFAGTTGFGRASFRLPDSTRFDGARFTEGPEIFANTTLSPAPSTAEFGVTFSGEEIDTEFAVPAAQ